MKKFLIVVSMIILSLGSGYLAIVGYSNVVGNTILINFGREFLSIIGVVVFLFVTFAVALGWQAMLESWGVDVGKKDVAAKK